MQRELLKVIHGGNSSICIKFVSTKLCRHFITDDLTEMINPVIEAWNKSNGT